MSEQSVARLSLSLLILAGIVSSGLERTPQFAVRAASMPPENRAATRTTLRVGMWTLWHDRAVVLTPGQPDRRIALRTCDGCATLTFDQKAVVRGNGNSLTLAAAGKTIDARHIVLDGPVTLAAHGETVTLHDPVTITARSGELVIAVTLPVESYVERVVASESGPADSAESLKALAIVVRSFALHEPHGHADYDLCDSTHCQLLHWGGNAGRAPAAHAAALSTAGETLWFHGQRALAYFGKDCGGRTASPNETWPHAKPVPYLPSQPDRFCAGAGGSEWASEISRSDLSAALAAHGLALPGWRNICVARRGESGRAVTVKIGDVEIGADEFRLAVGESLGWNRIPSTWFEVSQQGDVFAFHGRGWGHGVGLCQKGAAAMARQGRSAWEILAQYFPGTQAADEAAGREWSQFAGEGFVLESLDAADATFLTDLNRAHAEALDRSGIHVAAPITVRVFASTPAFRESTLAPGWVAAFTEGDWIGTQPLKTLSARRLLAGTMRHEFLHALVEQQAGPRAPLWLREGLVEFWADSRDSADSTGRDLPPTALTLDATDTALAHAATEQESAAAHRTAEWYAARLYARYGQAQMLAWLKSGVPAGVVIALGQR